MWGLLLRAGRGAAVRKQSREGGGPTARLGDGPHRGCVSMSLTAGREQGPRGQGIHGGSWGHRVSGSEGRAGLGGGAVLGQAGPQTQRGRPRATGKRRGQGRAWQAEAALRGQDRPLPWSLLSDGASRAVHTQNMQAELHSVSSNFSQILRSLESRGIFRGNTPWQPLLVLRHGGS